MAGVMNAKRAKRLAEIYTFEKVGNQYASFRQLLEEEGLDYSESTLKNANRMFRNPKVQEWIDKFQEEAQKVYDVRKSEIVACLKQIAFDETNTEKTRLTALKQLTEIGGYATQKVDVKADTNIELVIE